MMAYNAVRKVIASEILRNDLIIADIANHVDYVVCLCTFRLLPCIFF